MMVGCEADLRFFAQHTEARLVGGDGSQGADHLLEHAGDKGVRCLGLAVQRREQR